ncbi:hypothetical protein EYC84_010995 [Monilinia fructicola]|uniref:Uncharacterized protein n=1 Tax=Monilinia fructicola TaxID=38448 RepID=A0A5M9J9N0_MONFR|nr:hypothetical protein EYC84_010995 [Monilinia fructicola]
MTRIACGNLYFYYYLLLLFIPLQPLRSNNDMTRYDDLHEVIEGIKDTHSDIKVSFITYRRNIYREPALKSSALHSGFNTA